MPNIMLDGINLGPVIDTVNPPTLAAINKNAIYRVYNADDHSKDGLYIWTGWNGMPQIHQFDGLIHTKTLPSEVEDVKKMNDRSMYYLTEADGNNDPGVYYIDEESKAWIKLGGDHVINVDSIDDITKSDVMYKVKSVPYDATQQVDWIGFYKAPEGYYLGSHQDDVGVYENGTFNKVYNLNNLANDLRDGNHPTGMPIPDVGANKGSVYVVKQHGENNYMAMYCNAREYLAYFSAEELKEIMLGGGITAPTDEGGLYLKDKDGKIINLDVDFTYINDYKEAKLPGNYYRTPDSVNRVRYYELNDFYRINFTNITSSDMSAVYEVYVEGFNIVCYTSWASGHVKYTCTNLQSYDLDALVKNAPFTNEPLDATFVDSEGHTWQFNAITILPAEASGTIPPYLDWRKTGAVCWYFNESGNDVIKYVENPYTSDNNNPTNISYNRRGKTYVKVDDTLVCLDDITSTDLEFNQISPKNLRDPHLQSYIYNMNDRRVYFRADYDRFDDVKAIKDFADGYEANRFVDDSGVFFKKNLGSVSASKEVIKLEDCYFCKLTEFIHSTSTVYDDNDGSIQLNSATYGTNYFGPSDIDFNRMRIKSNTGAWFNFEFIRGSMNRDWPHNSEYVLGAVKNTSGNYIAGTFYRMPDGKIKVMKLLGDYNKIINDIYYKHNDEFHYVAESPVLTKEDYDNMQHVFGKIYIVEEGGNY